MLFSGNLIACETCYNEIQCQIEDYRYLHDLSNQTEWENYMRGAISASEKCRDIYLKNHSD